MGTVGEHVLDVLIATLIDGTVAIVTTDLAWATQEDVRQRGATWIHMPSRGH